MDGKVFISYSWKEPSGSIVNNWPVPSIKAAGINCLVDREACGYNANIDKFEADIPKAAKVVLVLSPAFLTSEDCMYEAALAGAITRTTREGHFREDFPLSWSIWLSTRTN